MPPESDEESRPAFACFAAALLLCNALAGSKRLWEIRFAESVNESDVYSPPDIVLKTRERASLSPTVGSGPPHREEVGHHIVERMDRCESSEMGSPPMDPFL